VSLRARRRPVPPIAEPRTGRSEGPADQDEGRFMREAHRLLRDHLEPDPVRYWADFLATITIAYAAFAVAVSHQVATVRIAALVVSSLAAYRAVVFTHELAHRPRGSFTMFTVAWNLLCGIPFWMPSFLYGDHKGHHTRPTYGTTADPEYLPLASRPRLRVLAFLSLALIYPVLGPLRFLLLTPLALVARPLDRLVWSHASSLYNMNEAYRRPPDALARSRSRWAQEVAASAWAWTVLWLAVTGRVPWRVLGVAYAVFALWMAVNQVRTLAAHRYANRPAAPLSHLDQVGDTNTFSRGRWLPHVWAPLGMRYHALHHLMPALPYHAMGAAHRRLLAHLPSDSPYRATLQRSLWHVVASMCRDARAPAPRLTARSARGPEVTPAPGSAPRVHPTGAGRPGHRPGRDR
jgi:fatty acid desaturase